MPPGFPWLDHLLNPGSARPGLISVLGVGLTVLALTAVLILYGLRGFLPRTGIFIGAALGYNALLIGPDSRESIPAFNS